MENRVFFSFSDNAVEKRSTKVHGPQNFEKHFSPHPHLRFLPYLRFCRARIFRRKAAIAWHQKRFFFSMLSLSTAILRAGCVASSGVSFIFDSFRNPLLRKFFSVPQRRYGPSSKMRSFFADCVSICPLGHREFMKLPFVSHNKTGMGRDYAFLR